MDIKVNIDPEAVTAAVRENVSAAFTEHLISKLWDTFVGQFVL